MVLRALPTRRYAGHLRIFWPHELAQSSYSRIKQRRPAAKRGFSSYDGFDRGFTGRLEWSCGNTIVLKSCVLKFFWDLYSSEDYPRSFPFIELCRSSLSHSSFLVPTTRAGLFFVTHFAHLPVPPSTVSRDLILPGCADRGRVAVSR